MNDLPFQLPFVGESRILLVDGLVSLYDQIIKSGEPRWVSFEAPSGWGKTRVVQEFYTRIANRQEKSYWPKSILENLIIERDQVTARRKRIFPDFKKIKREYGALPDFMWWGIACTQRGIVASEVLLEDLGQLDAHKLYLEAAWAAQASFKEKYYPSLDLAKGAFSNALEEGGATGLTNAIEAIANHTVFGLGLVVKLIRWGLGNALGSIEREKKLEYSGALAQNNKQDDLLEDTISIIIKLSQHIPTLLFVEDFHLASPLTILLIERLIRFNTKILIITTSWPEQLGQHHTIQSLFKDSFLKNRIHRVQNGEAPPHVFPANASFDELSQNSMQEIIRSYYPDVAPETLDKLARRYNNPLLLELVCSLPQYQRQFPNLALSTNEINRLPTSAKSIYLEIWNTLSDEVRQALTLATLGIPDQQAAWQKTMIQNAIHQLGIIQNRTAVETIFEADCLPKSWIRIIDNWFQRFSEPDQLHLVQENTHDHFSDDEVSQFLTLLAEAIGQQEFSHDDPATSHRAWLALSLHAKGLMEDHVVFDSILFLQQMLETFPRELPIRIELGKKASELDIDKNSTKMFQSRHFYANALGEAGELAKAIKQFETLLADQQQILGDNHPDTLTTRNNIAYWLAQFGKIAEAIQQFQTLLNDQQHILGKDHTDTLRTRNNIAGCLAQSGKVAEAIQQFQTLLNDQQRILDKDHPDTLTTRNNIADWLAESGKIAEAIQQIATLLTDQQRILDKDHPDTLTTRNNIAFYLGQVGQVTEAIEQLKTLLTDRQRILGDSHPDTLTTRNNLAYWLDQSK